MNLIAVSQRVCIQNLYKEKRDAIDTRWSNFFDEIGLLPIAIPNHGVVAKNILEKLPFTGIVLTGGNSPVKYGGNAPERDTVDSILIEHATKKNLPLIGVCRGMQSVVEHFGGSLHKVDGHVTPKKKIEINGKWQQVNSFHRLGIKSLPTDFDIWATAEDNEIKAISHKHKRIHGIMWHPERLAPFRLLDQEYFIKILKC